MEQDLSRAMYENAIGKLVVNYLESLGTVELPALAESSALKLIAEIKAVLDDGSLEDPECFRRIDALVDAFHARNVHTPGTIGRGTAWQSLPRAAFWELFG